MTSKKYNEPKISQMIVRSEDLPRDSHSFGAMCLVTIRTPEEYVYNFVVPVRMVNDFYFRLENEVRNRRSGEKG